MSNRGREVATAGRKPRQLRSSDEPILCTLSFYHYLTSFQMKRLLYGDGSLSYAQTRLKRLTDGGYIQRRIMSRAPGQQHGSAPAFYSLARKGVDHLRLQGIEVSARPRPSYSPDHPFLDHTLAANDVLIAATLFGRRHPSVALHRITHEFELKRRPVLIERSEDGPTAVVTDGFIEFRITQPDGVYQACLSLELDRGTEEAKQFRKKLIGLLLFADGPYQAAFETESLTIMVVTTAGSKRLADLVHWTELELERQQNHSAADLFRFAAFTPATEPLNDIFLARRWLVPFSDKPVPLFDEL